MIAARRSLTPAQQLRVVSRALLESVREKVGQPRIQTLPGDLHFTPQEREEINKITQRPPPPPANEVETVHVPSGAFSSMAACLLRFAQEENGDVDPELLARVNRQSPCPAEGICPRSGSRCPVRQARACSAK